MRQKTKHAKSRSVKIKYIILGIVSVVVIAAVFYGYLFVNKPVAGTVITEKTKNLQTPITLVDFAGENFSFKHPSSYKLLPADDRADPLALERYVFRTSGSPASTIVVTIKKPTSVDFTEEPNYQARDKYPDKYTKTVLGKDSVLFINKTNNREAVLILKKNSVASIALNSSNSAVDLAAEAQKIYTDWTWLR